MRLSGQLRRKLADALLDAFPDKSWLERMLYYELNKNLNVVTVGDNLEDLVFKLIQTAEAENWIEDLIKAVGKFNPGNQLLKEITEELLFNYYKTALNARDYNLQFTQHSNPQLRQLLEITVTGNKASELGANYTELRDTLYHQEFEKADFITAKKMLWIARREKEGWLRTKDIIDFPSRDLLTINKLWLLASEGKFGFTAQKEVWIDLGGKLGNYNQSIFKRFLEKVEWSEDKEIIFDLRATKGHLPLAVYVNIDSRLHYRWRAAIDTMLDFTPDFTSGLGALVAFIYLRELVDTLFLPVDWIVDRVNQSQAEKQPYFFFLSREDL